MDMKNLRITNTLNEKQKREVARLYYQAFPKKFSSLWLFTKNESQAVRVLAKSLRYKSGLYALSEDTVLGFIGLEKGNGFYAPLRYSSFREAFNIFSAGWRYAAYCIYRLFHGDMGSRTIHIDPIVVARHTRGMGIGSGLLKATFEYAKKLGKRKVVLEVVDTNPMARRLYEKHGFRVVKAEHLSLLTRRAGFDKLYHMVKDL